MSRVGWIAAGVFFLVACWAGGTADRRGAQLDEGLARERTLEGRVLDMEAINSSCRREARELDDALRRAEERFDAVRACINQLVVRTMDGGRSQDGLVIVVHAEACLHPSLERP